MSRFISIWALIFLGISISHSPLVFGGMLDDLKDSISTQVQKVKNKASYCGVKPKRFPSKKSAVMAKGASVYKGPSTICGSLGRTKSAIRIKVVGARGNWFYVEARSARGKTIRGWAKASTVSLKKTAKNAPPQTKSTPAYPKDMVEEVQQLLASRGYAPGAIDGVFGPATETALIAFQKDTGVEPTGKLDLDTLVLLKSNSSRPTTSPPDIKSPGPTFPKTAVWVVVDPDTGEPKTETKSRGRPPSYPPELATSTESPLGDQGDVQGVVSGKHPYDSVYSGSPIATNLGTASSGPTDIASQDSTLLPVLLGISMEDAKCSRYVNRVTVVVNKSVELWRNSVVDALLDDGLKYILAKCEEQSKRIEVNVAYKASKQEKLPGTIRGTFNPKDGLKRTKYSNTVVGRRESSRKNANGIRWKTRESVIAREASRSSILEFLRNTKAELLVDGENLTSNPYPYERKNVVVVSRFLSMTGKNEAIFADGMFFGVASNPFLVSGVPTTRFTEPMGSNGLLVAKVLGRNEANSATRVDYIDVYETQFRDDDLREMMDVVAGVTAERFVKLGANGKPLKQQDSLWSYDSRGVDNGSEESGTSWSCVQDKSTGLIWEVKKNVADTGLRDSSWTYSWYRSDESAPGGGKGYRNLGACDESNGRLCDTEAYIDAINTMPPENQLCGISEWRLPTSRELLSIHSEESSRAPYIVKSVFPNTAPSYYWTESYLVDSGQSKSVGFDTHRTESGKSSTYHARAVRLVHRPK